MSEKPLATTREALMAELLIDVDRLLNRIGELDQNLGDTIEKATKEASSKGFLAASLQIKRLTEDLEFKIQDATALIQRLPLATSTHNNPSSATRSHQQSAIHFLMGFLGAMIGACLVHALN